jgi:hypothetical protein
MAPEQIPPARLVAVSVLITLACTVGVAQADYLFGEPVNLGPNVNRMAHDGTPVMSADGLALYFDSNRGGGEGDFDVWVSTRATVEDDWGTPRNLRGPVNTPSWDGVPSIAPDGCSLYISSSRFGGSGGQDIWVSTRATPDDDWGEPVNLGPTVNSSSFEWTQSISADGLSLYVCSWRAGGEGEGDLWVTTRATQADEWTDPVNLGPQVNSVADDVNPSISPDGRFLFFYSTRPGGRGSRDIWMTSRATIDDAWGPAINLPVPINSGNMDQGASLSPGGAWLYFCSSRPGGRGGLDLMQAPIIPIVDFNGDGKVDAFEVLRMADYWGTDDALCDIGPTRIGDGIVDVADLTVLADFIGADVDDPTLVAHWALDETEGDIAYDRVSDSTGVVLGGATFRPGEGLIGGALELDGVDDCIETAFYLGPAGAPFTAMAWVKGGGARQVILSTADASNLLQGSMGGRNSAGGKLATEYGPQVLTSDVVVADGQWHRVALVWDGTLRMLYVDDVRVAEDQPAEWEKTVNRLSLGCGADQSEDSFFAGLIDDVRIYNRAVRP